MQIRLGISSLLFRNTLDTTLLDTKLSSQAEKLSSETGLNVESLASNGISRVDNVKAIVVCLLLNVAVFDVLFVNCRHFDWIFSKYQVVVFVIKIRMDNEERE